MSKEIALEIDMDRAISTTHNSIGMEEHKTTVAHLAYDHLNQVILDGQNSRQLKPKAAALLEYLCRQPGQLVSKDELLDAVWPGVVVGDAALKNKIRELRQALGDDPRRPRFIQTVHRRGYRFIGDSLVRHKNVAQDSAQSAVNASTMSRAGLVGRGDELAQLDERWQRALAGEQQMVFISGDPGVGKSSLVDAWLKGLGLGQEALCSKSHCLRQHSGSEAFLPILDALGRLCQGPHRDRFLALLGRHAPSWLAQLPWLQAEARQDNGLHDLASTGGEPQPVQLAAFLESLTQAFPLLLIFEDLDRADTATLDLLAYLGRREEPARLCIVGTARSWGKRSTAAPTRLRRELAPEGLFCSLTLEFFSPAEVETYLRQHCPERLLNGLPEALYRITEGHPQFVAQMVNRLLASGRLNSDGEPWNINMVLTNSEVKLPEKFICAIEYQKLETIERRVLQAGSVTPGSFPTNAVATMLEQDILDVEDACEGLARRGLWLERVDGAMLSDHPTLGERYRFSKALYRRYFHDVLPAAWRRHLQERWLGYLNSDGKTLLAKSAHEGLAC